MLVRNEAMYVVASESCRALKSACAIYKINVTSFVSDASVCFTENLQGFRMRETLFTEVQTRQNTEDHQTWRFRDQTEMPFSPIKKLSSNLPNSSVGQSSFCSITGFSQGDTFQQLVIILRQNAVPLYELTNCIHLWTDSKGTEMCSALREEHAKTQKLNLSMFRNWRLRPMGER